MNSTTASTVLPLSHHDQDTLPTEELSLHPELVPAPGRFDDPEARSARNALVRQQVTQLLAHIRRRSRKCRVAEYVARDLDLESDDLSVIRTANQNARRL